MAVRVNLDMTFSVSSTTADEKDLGNLKNALTSTAMGEGGSRKITLAAGVSDQEIELTNISTVRLLFVKVAPKAENDPGQAVTIKRNTVGGEAIEIKPFDDKKIGYFLLTTDSLTALFASNAGVIDVELTIMTAGD